MFAHRSRQNGLRGVAIARVDMYAIPEKNAFFVCSNQQSNEQRLSRTKHAALMTAKAFTPSQYLTHFAAPFSLAEELEGKERMRSNHWKRTDK